MNNGTSILVVDDEKSMCTYLDTVLSLKGYDVTSVMSGKDALDHIKDGLPCSVVILDIMMPEMDGLETLRKIREDLKSEVPVIILSALGKASTVVKAMKLGASDYITKPFEDEELGLAINNVLEKKRLVEEVKELKEQLIQERTRGEYFIGISENLNDIRKIIEQIADTDVTVLIQGESGVGKEVVARAIYANSSRKDKPFVKVNCAAIPGDLLESELFGYERGAFTGAIASKPGRFGLAHDGMILLDEIGEMSPALQAKILQVLQDGVFTRLGGRNETHVDVRILASTNKDLQKAVLDKTFREDLFYRLNVVNICIKPLRERKEDIPLFCENFLERYNKRYNRKVNTISKKLMKTLTDYRWPGNVRELENSIKKLVILEDENLILEELKPSLNNNIPKKTEDNSSQNIHTPNIPLKHLSKRAVLEVEKEMIQKALEQTNWNRKKAAEQLGISYKALLYKIKKMKQEFD
ncbi:MAG: sigma-54 dependent transcriptional regulator [Thermodesulfobacteriota bacterium]|nr:sigma-54 dependent transcriptional regulator [Thermodesulfobacteriota bacterium]